MLNSAEHEIFSANEYENANFYFSYLLEEKMSCSVMFSKKEFAIVSNLRFISRTNFEFESHYRQSSAHDCINASLYSALHCLSMT